MLFWSLSSTPAQAQQTTDSLKTYWTSGIRLNQGHLVGMLGITKQISSRLAIYTGGDFGGPEYSLSGTTLLRVTPTRRFTLYAILGPQAERISPTDDPDQLVTYLTAATGALATYTIAPDVNTWFGITYLITDANLDQWKIGAGLALPLNF
jgi:hypothetical protein